MSPRLCARRADITELAVDAIVNAANPLLAPGGGVCGAIHRRAGPSLADACARVGGCPVGEARLTPGFDLPARFVIHAVGPRWQGGERGEAKLLSGAYRACLRLAKQNGVRSLAFPALSTGIYGYPLTPATEIAVRTVREELRDPSGVEEVIFACFDDATLSAYRLAGVES